MSRKVENTRHTSRGGNSWALGFGQARSTPPVNLRPKRPGLSRAHPNLFYGGHSCAQAGLIARTGVLVDDALLHGFIDHRDRADEDLFGLLGIACLQGLAQLAQRGAQTDRKSVV